MSKGRILLTGSRGMVGRNILEHPLAAQLDIIAPDSRQLDLTDFAATLQFMVTVKPDAVIHSAGRVGGIQANIAHPVDFLVTNVDLGRNVILAARETRVKKLINFASSCMYPRNADNPLNENLILKGDFEPTNEGYAIAKVFATRLCQYIRREDDDLKYKTLIPCNLYGRHDKFAPEQSHLVPAIIHKIHTAKLTGASTVEIWGDGTARREFMYAGDIADATLRALEDLEELPETINIGLGCDYSINEYYSVAASVIGWQGEFVHDLAKPVGVNQKTLNIDRQSTWGWSPKTSLEEGISLTYRYYLEEYGR